MARNFCEITTEMENPISQRSNAEVKVAPKVALGVAPMLRQNCIDTCIDTPFQR